MAMCSEAMDYDSAAAFKPSLESVVRIMLYEPVDGQRMGYPYRPPFRSHSTASANTSIRPVLAKMPPKILSSSSSLNWIWFGHP
ncbi:unnamed protein product [Sphagnum balticum]